jgi:Uma2 family endonuclease
MTASDQARRTFRGDRLLLASTAEQIMAMAAQRTADRRWTEDEFYEARDAAPPGERWELVDGSVLATPSPHWTHQRAVARLFVLLDAYVRRQQIGETFFSPLDVKLEPGLEFFADVAALPDDDASE